MAAVTTASVWSVRWRWQPRFLFVILVAVTTAYGGDDRIVHRAVTTASQYTICVCLRYLRSQFGSSSAAWAFGRFSTVLCLAPAHKQFFLGLATRLLDAMAVHALYYHLRLFALSVAVTTAICFIGGGDNRYLLYWWR